jgi:hypothetical protein
MGLLLKKFPYITMDSGIVICNFTSFHDYWLRADEHDTIGEILPKCTKKIADEYKLKAEEKESIFEKRRDLSEVSSEYVAEWTDIELKYKIPIKVLIALGQLHNNRIDYVDVDIILIPFILMDLLKATDGHATIQEYRGLHKVRTCKKIDVRDVTQGIFNNRFCK